VPESTIEETLIGAMKTNAQLGVTLRALRVGIAALRDIGLGSEPRSAERAARAITDMEETLTALPDESAEAA
jgi:hypothetical protein